MEKKETKKKSNSRENTGEVATERDRFGEDDVVKMKSKKKKTVDPEAEDDGKKSKKKKKNKEVMVDSEAEHDGKNSKKKKTKVDYEVDRNGKKKKESDCDAKRKLVKRKRDDLGAEEITDKSKPSVDSEVEVNNKDSVKDAKKKRKKQSKDTMAEENNKNSMEEVARKKKPSEGSEAKDDDKNSKKKKKVDYEVDGNGKKEKESDGDDKRKTVKRKRDDIGAGEITDKSKPSLDSEVEETSSVSTKDAKNKKQSEDSEVELSNKDCTKDANKEKKKRKKQSKDSMAEENNKNSMEEDARKKKLSKGSEAKDSMRDANKEKKKKKKTKQMENSEAEEKDLNSTKESKKKKKKQGEEDAKKKQKSDKDVTTPSSKSAKKVMFSDQVEVFSAEGEETEKEEVGMVRGKRFTKEEDALLKKAVLEYIDNHALGDEGLNMVLQCQSHPQVKGCWREIANSLPWRPYTSIYYRAHSVFEEKSKGIWTEEDLQLVKEFQKKHGNDWKTLADAMGKHRVHVKDAWRRIRLASNKGHWSREEYQSLFDLVNSEIKMKAFKEKHLKHGMLRDNIPWMAISDQLGTRDHAVCCTKWYDQLTSPMVAKGIWANVDDYRLLEELLKLDAACIDDVDWDNLLENRDGEACRKRWNQMVLHIGTPRSITFAEQVEILSDRYCPELAEDREDFDNRPFDPED